LSEEGGAANRCFERAEDPEEAPVERRAASGDRPAGVIRWHSRHRWWPEVACLIISNAV
jgi:hypothetical protein